jgi:serine/threonine-protein kinase
MANASKPIPSIRSALGLLEVIRHSGVLSARQCDEIHSKVQGGSYPNDAQALAVRLVKKEVLTSYQARHLLHGQAEGLVVGRYVILDRLGRGAMGKVYKARHRLMGRTVALKFITREYLCRPNAVPRFLREMRLVGRLDHPNIVRALDAEEIGRDPCIIMEYVPGQDLERLLLDRGPLPPEEVVDYAIQAALGLAHAHERGVIHRDIKPSNLLKGEDGRIRILDLGLGALMDAEDVDQGSFATREGFSAGTTDYMSPEQAVGKCGLDGRTDLYSLGCVMYHLLAGQVPFPGDSHIERLASRIKERPVPLPEVRPGLPAGLVEVVDRLMATRREDRYATATEAAEALRAVGARDSSLPDPGQPAPVVGAATEGPECLGAGASMPDEPVSAPSTGVSPGAIPAWWLHLLTLLSDRPPALILAVGVLALLAAFAAGFLLSVALR